MKKLTVGGQARNAILLSILAFSLAVAGLCFIWSRIADAAVPSIMSDLNTTAVSNSPAGTDVVGATMDDFMRAGYSILRRESAKGADIASASSISPSTTGGNYFVVTGTTAINNIAASWTGRKIYLRFSGILQLTHSTALALPGATNITTAAGDILVFIQDDAVPNWRCLGILRNSPATSFRLIDRQVFTASGTWTKPAGTTAANARAVGAGGGGGGASGSAGQIAAGGGGGGGGTGEKFITTGLGATETVTVGAGGAGGLGSTPATGGTGGTSSFGAHVSATGGLGGFFNTPGSSDSRGGAGQGGGSGSGGSVNSVGGPGMAGIRFGVGVTGISGAGGNSVYGGGAVAVFEPLGGNPGANYGGGGSGGCSGGATDRNGGAGADGVVIIESFGL